MSDSWGLVFPGFVSPICGDVGSYTAAATACVTLESATEAAASEFHRVGNSEWLAVLAGAAANQLITVVGNIDGSFARVPPVFRSLADVFTKHAQQLEALRVRSAQALAVAHTRWNTLAEAQTSHSEATAAVAAIGRQISALESQAGSDPLLADLLASKYDDRHWLREVSARRQGAFAQAEVELAWSCDDHTTLVEAEQTIIDVTVQRVRDIHLGDLEDPNAFMAAVSAVASGTWNLVTDVLDSAAALANAVVEGDFMAAIWHLSEYLDAALTLLTVVVVGLLVVGSICCPALLTITPLLLAAVSGMAAGKAGLDFVIYGTQVPHPETGRPMSAVEVLTSVGSGSLGSATGRAASRVLVTLPRFGSRSVARQIASIRSLPASGPSSSLAAAAADARLANSSSRLGTNHGVREFVDEFGDIFGEPVDRLAIDAMVDHLPASWQQSIINPPTINPTAPAGADPSSGPAMVEFIGEAQALDVACRVERAKSSLRHFAIAGPFTGPTSPSFQVVSAGP